MREARPTVGRASIRAGRGNGIAPYVPQGTAAIGDEVLTELLTIAAAATTDTAILIPANTWVNQVEVTVTVVIPTAATFIYGIAGATSRYGTGISVAANTYSPGTIDGRRYYAAATAIRITPNATPANNSGRVRVTIHYDRG